MAAILRRSALSVVVIACVATAGLVLPGHLRRDEPIVSSSVVQPLQPPPAPVKPPLSAQEITARTRAVTVTIATDLGLLGVAGTGVVLTNDGQVLTNYHVIAGAQKIEITHIGNGLVYNVDVVGYDKTHDLAVLKMQTAHDLVPAALGSSAAVVVGAAVTAVGNAGGTGALTEASGVVTDLGQSITAESSIDGSRNRLADLIEVNADVRAGDSGGPLVDAYGDVIGIDAAGLSEEARTGTASKPAHPPQAYAIPIDQAEGIVDQIRSGVSAGTVHAGPTAFLGVSVTSSSAAGARVVTVDSDSPAQAVGVAVGDVITMFGGSPITSADDLKSQMNVQLPGARVPTSWRTESGDIRSDTIVLTTGTPIG